MSLNRHRRPRAERGWLLLLALSAACSARSPDGGVVAAYDASAPVLPADAGTVPVAVGCTPDNPFCGDAGPTAVNAGPVCGNAPINLEPVGVNVMVAVDGSKAMSGHWETMQHALKKMIEENLSLNFGAHLFWADVSSLEMVLDKLNFCGTTQNRVLDVGPGQQTQLLPFLGAVPPGPGAEFFSFRPVVEPLNYYLENASKLGDPKSTNYLVFISNGADNCFGTLFARDEDKLLTYEHRVDWSHGARSHAVHQVRPPGRRDGRARGRPGRVLPACGAARRRMPRSRRGPRAALGVLSHL